MPLEAQGVVGPDGVVGLGVPQGAAGAVGRAWEGGLGRAGAHTGLGAVDGAEGRCRAATGAASGRRHWHGRLLGREFGLRRSEEVDGMGQCRCQTGRPLQQATSRHTPPHSCHPVAVAMRMMAVGADLMTVLGHSPILSRQLTNDASPIKIDGYRSGWPPTACGRSPCGRGG